MMTPAGSKIENKSEFGKVLRGYLGFLVGTGKSSLTRRCYAGDLALFQNFLQQKKLDFFHLAPRDFAVYDHFLKERGLKANTRRRKLLTARALYRYAVSRKKLGISPAQFLAAPARVERLPWVPSAKDYQNLLLRLDGSNPLTIRNRLIVRLMAETGISLAELCALEWSDFSARAVTVRGKRLRNLELSKSLAADVERWRRTHKGKSVFPGFNRHGMTSLRMTHRGVEVVFRVLARRCERPKLNPKSLRHFAVVTWFKAGVKDTEIRRRLGLSSQYSFFLYDRVRSGNA